MPSALVGRRNDFSSWPDSRQMECSGGACTNANTCNWDGPGQQSPRCSGESRKTIQSKLLGQTDAMGKSVGKSFRIY